MSRDDENADRGGGWDDTDDHDDSDTGHDGDSKTWYN